MGTGRDTRLVKLWRLKETSAARLFATMPEGDPARREVWVPRSVTSHLSVRDTRTGECVAEIEEGFLENHDL